MYMSLYFDSTFVKHNIEFELNKDEFYLFSLEVQHFIKTDFLQ